MDLANGELLDLGLYRKLDLILAPAISILSFTLKIPYISFVTYYYWSLLMCKCLNNFVSYSRYTRNFVMVTKSRDSIFQMWNEPFDNMPDITAKGNGTLKYTLSILAWELAKLKNETSSKCISTRQRLVNLRCNHQIFRIVRRRAFQLDNVWIYLPDVVAGLKVWLSQNTDLNLQKFRFSFAILNK